MPQPTISVPFANTYWVVPGQFLAGEHPVEISDDATMARLAALLDAGVRTLVDLTEEPEIVPSYSGLLRGIATGRQIEIEIRQMPIPDRGVPSAQTLKSILDVIDCSMTQKNPVFVHCFAGIGRTGTIVGCYLRRHGWANARDVIARISELRSLMPCGGETSPQTPEQVEVVMSWKEGC